MSFWRSVLGCKCPACGKGDLFQGYLTQRDICNVCGYHLGAYPAGDGPAYIVLCFLCFFVVPPALWLGLKTTWPLWVHLVLWSVIMTGLTLLLLRPVKAFIIVMQYKYKTLKD